MINTDIKSYLVDAIQARKAFIDTTFDDTDKEAWLSYHAIPMFDGYIIYEDYSDHMTNLTEFLYFAHGELRDCTPLEDDYLRSGDQEDYPILENDETEFIISKTWKGVYKFDDEVNQNDQKE